MADVSCRWCTQVMVLQQKDVDDLHTFLEEKLRLPPYQIRLNTTRGSLLSRVRRVYVTKGARDAVDLPICLHVPSSVKVDDTKKRARAPSSVPPRTFTADDPPPPGMHPAMLEGTKKARSG